MSVRSKIAAIEARKDSDAFSIVSDETTMSTSPVIEDSALGALQAIMQQTAEAESARATILSKIPSDVREAAGIGASADIETALEAVSTLAQRLLPKHTMRTDDSLPDPKRIIGSTTPLAQALSKMIERARQGNVRDRLYARQLHVDYLSLDGLKKVTRKLSLDVIPGQDPYEELTKAIGSMISSDEELFGDETIDPETAFGVETPVQQALSELVLEAREGGNRNTSLMLEFLNVDRYTLSGAENIDQFILGDIFTRIQKEYSAEMNQLEVMKEAIRRMANDYVLLANAMKSFHPTHPAGIPVIELDSGKSTLENGLIVKRALSNPFTTGLTRVSSIRIDGMNCKEEEKLNHVPETIAQLSSLTHLELPRNNLCKLPASLASLNLKKLDIEGNRVLEIPRTFAGNTTLTHVNLSGNRIFDLSPLLDSDHKIRRGTTWVKPEKQLVVLNVSGNNISEIPDTLDLLPRLRSFDISRNRVEMLPRTFTSMKALTHVDISRNSIETLPRKLGELTHLTMLNASNNPLLSLPESIESCENLYSLSVADAYLMSLPQLPRKLESLDVSGNRLTELGDNFGLLTKLRFINASSNRLSSVTPDLRRIGTIHHFNVRGNEPLSYLPPQLRWVKFTAMPLVDTPKLLEDIGYEHRPLIKTVSHRVLQQIAQGVRKADPRYTYYKVKPETNTLEEIIFERTLAASITSAERYVMKKVRWKKDFILEGKWPF